MGLAVTQTPAPRRDRSTGAHATWARTNPTPGPTVTAGRVRRDWQTRWNTSLTPHARLRAAISLVLAALVALRRADPDRHALVMDETAWTLYHLATSIRARADGARS